MNKCMCQKSETRFLAERVKKQMQMFIVLFRSFLAGLELNLQRHILSQKNVSIELSLTISEIFKGMSHNLELLSF